MRINAAYNSAGLELSSSPGSGSELTGSRDQGEALLIAKELETMREHPLLVVLPGVDGSSRFSLSFQHALPESMDSSLLTFPDAMLDQQQLQDHVQEQLSTAENVVLLGQSWSAPLAMEVARSCSSIQGLVLVTSPWHRRANPILRRAFHWTPQWLLRIRPPRFALQWLLLDRQAPPEQVKELQSAVRSVKRDVIAARLRLLGKLMSLPPPEPVPLPTLCLHAARDRLLSGPVPEERHDPADLVQHATISGPHLLLLRNPEAVADQVIRFITQLSK